MTCIFRQFKDHLSSVSRVFEFKPEGAQSEQFCPAFAGIFVFTERFPVFSVPDKGISQMSHLNPDLMMAPCVQADLYAGGDRFGFAGSPDHLIVQP